MVQFARAPTPEIAAAGLLAFISTSGIRRSSSFIPFVGQMSFLLITMAMPFIVPLLLSLRSSLILNVIVVEGNR